VGFVTQEGTTRRVKELNDLIKARIAPHDGHLRRKSVLGDKVSRPA
jgi:hypothetical protein